jgi:arabinose-5-phosphate isomerase
MSAPIRAAEPVPAVGIEAERVLKLARDVLATEAAAIRALEGRLGAAFLAAARALFECRGRVVVTGIGKSGHIARKLAATLASTGTPAFFVHAAEASHGDLGMITADDIVLLLSNSGETDELVSLVPHFKHQGAKLIALTGNEQSSLAFAADVHLDASVDTEACPLGLAPTASTTAALALGDALALTLLDARGFSVEDFARSHPGGSLGRKLLTHVRDVMRTGVALPMVPLTASFADAIVEMSGKGMGMTVVVERAIACVAYSPTAICAAASERSATWSDARHRRNDPDAAHGRPRAARDRLRRDHGNGAQSDATTRYRRRGTPPRRHSPPRFVPGAYRLMDASIGNDLLARIRGIRLLTCDVDGVLTDSRIFVDDHGREIKAYSALDGHGLKMLMHAGIAVGWITGSKAPAVMHRARQLGVQHLVQGAEDKLTPWHKLIAQLGLPPEACAHIGDDLPDVPLFNRCGLAVAVPHAPAAVRARTHYVTHTDGGAGACAKYAS